MKKEGQELYQLVGRQHLYIRVFKGAQVLVFGLNEGGGGLTLNTRKTNPDPCDVPSLTLIHRCARAMQASASVVSYLKHETRPNGFKEGQENMI